MCVEALLSDDLAHGIHEHCGCASGLACVECGVNRTRLHIDEHLRCCSGARHADSSGTAHSDNLARCGTFGRRFLVEVFDDFSCTVSLDALDVVDSDGSRNLRTVEVETDGVCRVEVRGFGTEVCPLDLESLERGGVELLVGLFQDAGVEPCPCATGHHEEVHGSPAVFAAAVACAGATARGGDGALQADFDADILGKVGVRTGKVDTERTHFAGVGG